MLILGLTGGIATGKSTVSSHLRSEHNIPIIDADVIARQVVEPGTPAYAKIVAHFQDKVPDLLLPPAEQDKALSTNTPGPRYLNRPALGRAIFGNEKERLFLNSVVHPAVRREMLRQAVVAYLRGHDIVVLDVPLLFESKLDRFCSTSVVVACSPELEFTRLRARDAHLTEEDARQRIASQMDLDVKRSKAGLVIENDGTLEELKARVDEVVEKVKPSKVSTLVAWLGPPVALGSIAIGIWLRHCKARL